MVGLSKKYWTALHFLKDCDSIGGMKRKPAAPVFKAYVMNQTALLPPSYAEKIPEKHLVRVVNEAIEKIDVSGLLAKYKGGGTLSYHPKMMLKVLVYAYAKRIYSSRRIAEALRENIYFNVSYG